MNGPISAHRKPRPLRDGGVDVFHGGHALAHQVEGLAPQSGLQAVGNVPFDLAPYLDGTLADMGIERHRISHRLGRGALAAAHFDQRDHVRRIERV